jgi:hypothetical protein
MDSRDILAAARAFLRDDTPDELLGGVWRWALDHRLVRPLEWLRERAPWECVETYFHSNYARSVLCMAVEILGRPGGPFPDFPQLASSPLRRDPHEVEEYLALARAARHITPEDLALIEAAVRRPLPARLDARSIDALTLAGAPAVGDEHSFEALALYQVKQLSADQVRTALYPPATVGSCEPDLSPKRQVVERWISGAAVLLVGRVHAKSWMRDFILAGPKPQ